jgi:S1-C subfamily serine protease
MGTGTGFLVGKRRIMTNAHVVSDARFLEVEKDGDAKRYRARVTFVGHDCDLASLTVDEPGFFDGMARIGFARELPDLNKEVVVIGYPMGGHRVSVTRGVVSRIDYSLYSHSGLDHHLVLQVDAAINPGNSGGPILYGGRVVAVAFQGYGRGENLGYGIPLPVIRHFIDDIEDGEYNGYPELGVSAMNARNPALRRSLQMPLDESGTVVSYVDPFGSAKGLLFPRDVLLSINGVPIADNGAVMVGGTQVNFTELVERAQWGETASFRVWRGGKVQKVTVPLRTPYDPFLYRNEYGKKPEYFIVGGLVFSPLTRGYLRTLRNSGSRAAHHVLRYYARYAKLEELYVGRDEFVVMIRRLPHPVNAYADSFIAHIVADVNGVPIRRLADVKRGIDSLQDGYHVIRFEAQDDYLVLDAKAAATAERSILETYGVAHPSYFREAQ